MNFGTFDPGGKCAGYAIFDGRTLVEVGLSRTKAATAFERAADHYRFVRGRMEHWGVTRIRAEAMVFRQRENKGNPQVLIDLNLITGHVGTEWVEPHTWKGRVPKEIHQPKILAALEPNELALVEAVMPPSLRHNAIDAVGIGLNAVGRLPVTPWQATAPKVLVKPRTKRSARASTRGGRAGTSSAKKKRTPGKPRPKLRSFSIAPFKMPSS